LDKTPIGKKKREVIFKEFDPNGNGMLSLTEIDRGVREILQCDHMFDVKPAIIRAFNSANKAFRKKGKVRSAVDFIELKEFRLFLV